MARNFKVLQEKMDPAARMDNARRVRDELRRMVGAIHRTQLWVAEASGADIADAVADYFADVPPVIRAAACARYQALGIWSTTPVLPRAGYDRLLSSLVSGGFVAGTAFEVAVDNNLAEKAMASARA